MLHNIAIELKLTFLATLAGSAWLADISNNASGNAWEEWGLKGILLVAVVTIGKLFLQSQKDHKAELAEAWKSQKEEAEKREAALAETIKQNTTALDTMSNLAKEQTDWFRAVTRGVVSDKLGSPKLP